MDILQQLGTALGLGLMSGVRLYLTLLAIGAAIRMEWLHLNDSFAGLNVLADWRVMAVAGTACIIEFVADKVPWVDSAWDSIHTFIRPIGAVLLSASAFANTDPVLKMMLMIVCGSVALTGHTAKSATRLAVNHSPEPFSNIALSLAGDAVIPLATWATFNHPLITLGVVSAFLVVALWLSPKIFRSLRVELAALGSLWDRWFGPSEFIPAEILQAHAGLLPPAFADHLRALPMNAKNALGASFGVRCFAASGLPGFQSSIGYLSLTPDGRLIFAARRWFRWKRFEVRLAEVTDLEWKKQWILDALRFRHNGKLRQFDIFAVPAPSKTQQAKSHAPAAA